MSSCKTVHAHQVSRPLSFGGGGYGVLNSSRKSFCRFIKKYFVKFSFNTYFTFIFIGVYKYINL